MTSWSWIMSELEPITAFKYCPISNNHSSSWGATILQQHKNGATTDKNQTDEFTILTGVLTLSNSESWNHSMYNVVTQQWRLLVNQSLCIHNVQNVMNLSMVIVQRVVCVSIYWGLVWRVICHKLPHDCIVIV